MSCAHGSSYLASQYENVRKQARSMKESYEERVRTLEAEVAQLTETNDRSLAKAREVATALQRQVREARQEGDAKVQQVREEQDGDSKQELDAEVSVELRYDVTGGGKNTRKPGTLLQVKRIMSQVFKVMKLRFKAQSRYVGANIHQATLDTVKVSCKFTALLYCLVVIPCYVMYPHRKSRSHCSLAMTSTSCSWTRSRARLRT